MASPINKQPEEPQHRYDLPPPAAPIEESFVPGAPGEGAAKPIRDQIAPSTAATSSQHVKRPDAPELPIPTLKAINRAAAQAAAKKEATEKAETANPWRSASSPLAALFQVLFEIQSISSQTRFTEAKLKAVIEEYAFKLGNENADLAKTLKDLAANKEFIRAVGSFVNAGISSYQLVGIGKARGAAEAQANREFDPKITSKKEDIDRLTALKAEKDAGIPLAPPMGYDPADPAHVAAYDAAVADRNAKMATVETDLAQAKKDLPSLEKEKREAINQARSEETQKASSTGDIFKHTTEGCIGVLTTVYTGKEGETEKQKGTNDALMQVFHKLSESTNKAKDDLQQNAERVMQQIERTSEANLNIHRMGRG